MNYIEHVSVDSAENSSENKHGINMIHANTAAIISDNTLLQRWHEKFSTLRVKHIGKARECRIIYVILGICATFSSAVGTLFSTIGTADATLMSVTAVSSVNMILHFSAFFITAILHFLDLSGRKVKHLTSSHNYANLLRQIEYLQTLQENERNIKPILELYYNYIKVEPVISICC